MLLVLLQVCRLVRKDLIFNVMFVGLLILSIVIFIYLMYVLVKPEKF